MNRSEVIDGISALPDCLLVEIISRLPTIRSAIRTGTLSKRWESLWTSIHTLIFDDRDINLPPSEFVSFVDKTLTQSRQSKLIKLAITTRFCIHFESQAKKWIRHATSCNVEKLHLNFHYFPTGSIDVLDEGFFINSCFTDLRLSCLLFNPKGAISWKRLKNFYIRVGNVDVDVIQNILSGCPLLETLELDECCGRWQLVITSNVIKKLVFFNRDDHDEFQTQINNVFLYAINSNVEVLDLDFNAMIVTPEILLNECFFINSCFTDLRLGCCIFDTKVTISWKMLRRLCIFDGHLDKDMIENILSGSPLLETLELEDCYGYKQLDVTSRSVKNLVITQDCDRGDRVVIANVINASNILSLTIRGRLYLWKLMLFLSTMPSLVEVTFDLHGWEELPDDGTLTLEEVELAEEETLKGLIRRFCHVNELKFEGCYLKGTHKQAMLEKYRQDILTKYQNAMIASISEEVQQLKRKNQKMEHEQAEMGAKMKEMENKLKTFEEFFSRFPRPSLG